MECIIYHFMDRIKHFLDSEQGKDFLVILVVALVGILAFGLGRLSKSSSGPGIQVRYQNGPETSPEGNFEPIKGISASSFESVQSVTSLENKASGGGAFFASSKGSKYYPAKCSAGKSIKVENRIYFDTREDAEKAGYELSGSCR